jgi:predicted extracellular nuclease
MGRLLIVTIIALAALPVMGVSADTPSVVISEIRIDQPDTDNDEYFELAGPPRADLTGLTYLVIGDGTGVSGCIEAVVHLTGYSIPGDGYFVAAEDTFSLGTADMAATLNFENDDNVTHLLVSGFSGSMGDDLDTDDDGVLDVMPWSDVLDLIALVKEENPPASTEYHYGPPSVGPDDIYVPGHALRCVAYWQIGSFDPVGGRDTPGSPNDCSVPFVPVISEIRIDQPATDNDEYFELLGPPGSDLSGVTYLVIGDGTGGSGTLEAAIDLTGQAIPASGYFVVAESSFTMGTADMTTTLNFENDDNVTHLLVVAFYGSVGDDLDTDDDGVLDITPWSVQLDRIALVKEENPPSTTEYHYGPPSVGPDTIYVPGHVYACPFGWQMGDFDPGGGRESPGAPNYCDLAPKLVINEIDYDQGGFDDDEFIELTNTGEFDASLSGYVIHLVDGSDASLYHITALPSVATVAAGGYFVVCTDNSGVAHCDYEDSFTTHDLIQDGSPDAVALLLDGDIVDTVSYEGNTAAPYTEGTALTVEDDGSGPGRGISRCPDGSDTDDNDADFEYWGITPGAANVCAPPQLVINEIDYDQPGTDDAEFIEIANTGQFDVNLGGVSIDLVYGLDVFVYQSIDLPSVVLAAGDYFVVCGDAANVPNCDLDESIDIDLILNGSPDAVALRLDDALLDTVSYEGNTPGGYTEGTALTVEDDGSEAGMGISRCPDGSDTDDNDADFEYWGITPGAANVCTLPPRLVINEIDYDQPGTDDAEFIEIANVGGTAAHMGDYRIDLIFGGEGAVRYDLIYLPAASLAARDYFVVCGDAANVPNCDLDVSPDTDLIWNGSPDAVALLLDGVIVDTVSYEGNTASPYTEGTAETLEDDGSEFRMGISRCPDGNDTDDNDADFAYWDSTPGLANDCGAFVCGDAATRIHQVQGSGATSPLVGTSGVVIEGVVVGDYQDTAVQLGGFFVQEEDSDTDADPTTSEGIFVYDNGFGADVIWGDVVRVEGSVGEYDGRTELNSITQIKVCHSGSLVSAAEIVLPVPAAEHLERHEGMLTVFTQTLYATDTYDLGRYGVVSLSAGGALYQPTSVVTPGAAANALQDLNDRSRVLLDDTSLLENPPILLYLAADNTLRLGDTVTGLIAVLDERFGEYRLQPTALPPFVRENARTSEPADMGGSFKVASFNVLNYFNGDGLGGGFPTARGAHSLAEFVRQREKLVAAIVALEADVIGLMELENDGYGAESAIQDLVNGLNAVAPVTITYGFIDPGTPQLGLDEISVGLIYRLETAAPVGPAVTTSAYPFDDLNRQPLAQTFQQVATGEKLTVVVNHFKSKGSCPSDGSLNEDQGDGQACWNALRVEAANALVAWLATDPMSSGDPDVLLVGDLNGYALEDPIVALEAAGYDNLIDTFEGPYAWSYVYMGQSGYLNHALANTTLRPQVVGVTTWHINADEPRSLDYNDDILDPGESSGSLNLAYLYSPDAYRSSDHDPTIVHLDLGAPVVSIGMSGDDVVLSWDVVGSADVYGVYRDTVPYFTPSGSNLHGITGGLTYSDWGALLEAESYYYLVTAAVGADYETAPSNEVGKFWFGLVPGGQ